MKATKQAPAKNSANGQRKSAHTRRDWPTGNSWGERFARGVRICREQAGLSIPAVTARCKLHHTTWYRLEDGTYPQQSGALVDLVCKFFDKDVIEILRLGTGQPR